MFVDHTYAVTMGSGDTRRTAIIDIYDIIRSKSGRTAKIWASVFLPAADYFDSPHKNEVILLHQRGYSDNGEVSRWTDKWIPASSIIDVVEEVELAFPDDYSALVPLRNISGISFYPCYWTMAHGKEGVDTPAIFRIPLGNWRALVELEAHPEVIDHERPGIYTNPATLELHAGCGGTARGFDDAGFQVVAAVESDTYAALAWEV